MAGSLELLAVFLASLTAGGALVMSLSGRRAPRAASPAPAPAGDGTSFLFEVEDLVDATPEAQRLLAELPSEGEASVWSGLVARLERRFPGLSAEIGTMTGPGRRRLAGRNGDSGLEIERWDRMTRLTLFRGAGEMTPVHPVTLEAMEEDVALLSLIADATPLLIWRTSAAGEITWACRAYLELADAVSGTPGTEPSWPPPALFQCSPAEGEIDRVPLRLADGTERWFDLQARRSGADTLWIGTDADALVTTERLQRSFVQTLSKTFAELSVGLAIFDRRRRLVMFNPALMDLTGLPPGQLAGRPTIRTFLDALRERLRLAQP